MPKKKSKGGGGKKQQPDADDDDWEALLAATPAAEGEAPKEEAAEPPAAPDAEAEAEAGGAAPAVADDAAAAFLAAMGKGAAGGAEGEEKKKKKKKKPAAKKKPAEKEEKQLSAAGKLVLAQQEAMRAEQARLDAEAEEAERQAEAEQGRIDAHQEKLAAEKAAKKAAKDAKVAKQKADGTYLTKAQKKKKQLQEQRLAASGILLGKAGGDSDDAEAAPVEKKAVVYGKKKKSAAAIKAEEEAKAAEAEAEAAAAAAATAEAAAAADDAGDDDWETADIVVPGAEEEEKAAEQEDVGAEAFEDEEEEDLLAKQQRLEKERMLKQGREAKVRKAAEEKRKEGMDGDLTKQEAECELLKDESRARREQAHVDALAARSLDKLRSPIGCIMGHVDTGKTKLLDKIRKTNVQDNEAGGITQQIGASFFPVEAIRKQTAKLNKTVKLDIKLPGILIIDTPGHESFTNLRSRGSSLCDIAIVVIDITHGLEPQTIESLQLLKRKKRPFVVALNKVDRCYGWKACPNSPIRDALAKQSDSVIREFKDRMEGVLVQLAEQGLNSKLYYENDDLRRTVSVIPTSAISGEGIPDLLLLLVQLTQTMMAEALQFCATLQCTVLEVKVIEGLGTTIDCVLVNGVLEEGQEIVVATLDGPCVTTIRALLTPQPMREMRVKADYIHHSRLEAAMGVKIAAHGLERAIAGTSVHVVGPDDDVEDLKEEAMSDLQAIMDSIKRSPRGVYVTASTLGALEALLEFLANGCDPPIPVNDVSIGPVFKKDVMKCGVMVEKQPELACVLCFDVKVDEEAKKLAAKTGVKIFTADIIYHLFDQFTKHMDDFRQKQREANAGLAVFPCVLKIMPTCIFNKKDPIVIGVNVVEGIVKVGTPLVIPNKGNLVVGKIIGIENNNKPVDRAKKGTDVAISIQADTTSIMYGRQASTRASDVGAPRARDPHDTMDIANPAPPPVPLLELL